MRKGVKEWAAIIEGLGSGKQTLLIRTSPPPINEFLLYPTLGRGQAVKPAFDGLRAATERTIRKNEVEIEFFCRVVDTLRVSLENCLKLDGYFVWTREHVERYLTHGRSGSACIWLVRVFKLPSKVIIPRAVGGNIAFYNHKEEISTEGAEGVLTESQFAELSKEIRKLCQGGKVHSDVKVMKLSDVEPDSLI